MVDPSIVDEDRLDDLLVVWGEARKDGREISAEDLCENFPELLDEVKRGIHALKSMSCFIDLEDDASDDDFLQLPGFDTVPNQVGETLTVESSLTIDEFFTAIVESGLLDADQVQQLRKIHPPEDALSFARQLISDKKLTPFQASVLLNGRDQPLLLDRYIILDEIGSGGMGAVFKALHRQMDRVVALKILPKAAVDSPDKVKRFHREMRAAAKLEHPNIVTAFDAHESKGIHYLVMSYVNGSNLAQTVRKQGPLCVSVAVNYIVQAASGLGHAHETGIIHRDVKPGNLLLDKRGVVRVLDLGLASFESSDAGRDEAMSRELTHVGAVMGTVTFIAPEQALDTRNADVRSDIYSLGCTLYYLLTGNPIFLEDTMMKTIMAHQQAEIPVLENVPDDVEAVFQKMVAKNPDERYQSMKDVILALEATVVEEQRVDVTEPTDSWSPAMCETATMIDTSGDVRETVPDPQSPRRRWPLIAACLLGIIGGVWAASLFLEVDTPEGTIILEIDQPELAGAVVSVDGERKVTITTLQGKEPIEVIADKNTHTLKIAKGGFETFTERFTVKAGAEQTIRVRLKPKTILQKEQSTVNLPPSKFVDDASPAEKQQSQQASTYIWPKDQPAPAIAPFDTEQSKQHQQEWAKHLGVKVETTNSIGMNFRVIPPGEFLMGSSEAEIEKFLKVAKEQKLDADYYQRIPDEGPQHKVVLTQPFGLAIHEVTRAQFRQFVSATGYRTDAEKDGEGGYGFKDKKWCKSPDFLWDTDPGFDIEPTGDHPVVNVSWNDAEAFCKWLSKEEGVTYRLPTEAEWEFACRGGSAGQFCFDETESKLSEYAWYASQSGTATKPVGKKLTNALGLFDLHGNVWEWCSDQFGPYEGAAAKDPRGPLTDRLCVLRGGAYTNFTLLVRSTNRKCNQPIYRNVNLGFRLARTYDLSP